MQMVKVKIRFQQITLISLSVRVRVCYGGMFY